MRRKSGTRKVRSLDVKLEIHPRNFHLQPSRPLSTPTDFLRRLGQLPKSLRRSSSIVEHAHSPRALEGQTRTSARYCLTRVQAQDFEITRRRIRFSLRTQMARQRFNGTLEPRSRRSRFHFYSTILFPFPRSTLSESLAYFLSLAQKLSTTAPSSDRRTDSAKHPLFFGQPRKPPSRRSRSRSTSICLHFPSSLKHQHF
jgi:hypothetical protein